MAPAGVVRRPAIWQPGWRARSDAAVLPAGRAWVALAGLTAVTAQRRWGTTSGFGEAGGDHVTEVGGETGHLGCRQARHDSRHETTRRASPRQSPASSRSIPPQAIQLLHLFQQSGRRADPADARHQRSDGPARLPVPVATSRTSWSGRRTPCSRSGSSSCGGIRHGSARSPQRYVRSPAPAEQSCRPPPAVSHSAGSRGDIRATNRRAAAPPRDRCRLIHLPSLE